MANSQAVAASAREPAEHPKGRPAGQPARRDDGDAISRANTSRQHTHTHKFGPKTRARQLEPEQLGLRREQRIFESRRRRHLHAFEARCCGRPAACNQSSNSNFRRDLRAVRTFKSRPSSFVLLLRVALCCAVLCCAVLLLSNLQSSNRTAKRVAPSSTVSRAGISERLFVAWPAGLGLFWPAVAKRRSIWALV